MTRRRTQLVEGLDVAKYQEHMRAVAEMSTWSLRSRQPTVDMNEMQQWCCRPQIRVGQHKDLWTVRSWIIGHQSQLRRLAAQLPCLD